MDDDDFGEFGIASKKISVKGNFARDVVPGLEGKAAESGHMRFATGLGLAAMQKLGLWFISFICNEGLVLDVIDIS